jgi:four helix bundle protein
MERKWQTLEQWVQQVPDCVKQDKLWEFEAYRKALFFADLAWLDCEQLLSHRLGRELISQLLRSTSSISANIEEGYSRGYGRDYARFLRIAEGSAREARGWYYRNRGALAAEVVQHRMELATSLIKALTITANQQRLRKTTPIRKPTTNN